MDYAGQNQFRLHIAITYVAVLAGRIVGFATVAVGSMERTAVPSVKLRRRLPAYLIPILRLARLGVDTRAQGLRVGGSLLRYVLNLAVRQRDSLGCLGVVADAKSSAVDFYKRYGFVPFQMQEGTLHGEPVPMFLPMDTIAKALPLAT